ncbi:PucR family transcriptional regulator [Nocardia alni]|uniref:PucR family transcriptional regulator n=1 Tax=Nocardia alni TaxID=2815723 RepID=UPI001C2315FD|nr:helix-turn-helix domain-containing protein [Nocardia alni]
MPDDTLRGDVTAVTVNCLTIATAILDGRGTPAEHEVAQLEAAAGRWARAGIPVDVILHALHEGSKMAHALVTSQATVTTVADCVDLGTRTIALLDLMNTTVTMAYLREYRSVTEHHAVRQTLTTALLEDRATSAMARAAGTTIAESYHVLAISLAPHPAEHIDGLDRSVAGRRKIRRAQSALTHHTRGDALSLLSSRGGTILIPSDTMTPNALAPLIKTLAEAAQVPVVAVHGVADADAIKASTKTLHEMLDLASRLHGTRSDRTVTRLYRFGELSAEHQVTRPGPARDILAAKLIPLADQPALLDTLRLYLLLNGNRQEVAHRLYIHPNTLDYRLKRITALTGADPTRADGQWQLRAALIAQTFDTSNHTTTAPAGDEPTIA